MADIFDDSELGKALKRIRDLIAQGELKEALAEERDLALNGPQALADEVTALAGRYAQLSRQERMGVVNHNEALTERAKIASSALAILDEVGNKLTAVDAPVQAPSVSPEAFEGVEPVQYEKIIGL